MLHYFSTFYRFCNICEMACFWDSFSCPSFCRVATLNWLHCSIFDLPLSWQSLVCFLTCYTFELTVIMCFKKAEFELAIIYSLLRAYKIGLVHYNSLFSTLGNLHLCIQDWHFCILFSNKIGIFAFYFLTRLAFLHFLTIQQDWHFCIQQDWHFCIFPARLIGIFVFSIKIGIFAFNFCALKRKHG